ncbi:uncharacterized protein LOC128387117 [Panonychus citri]|uniref:uncharacterized protein LOC128387117 n=1 Tax=Panonychus citri TaxID=50023 RepID=UPI002307ECEA|nr:uncharacterized protein LOC128387117 [Panonychus citri]
MPNLETLALLDEPKIEPPKWLAPKMNLKQLSIENIFIEYSSPQVSSLFPELPSLYLNIAYPKENETFPTSKIHPNVQDLVLEIDFAFDNLKCNPDIEYSKMFKNILVKFPYCKNLMIRLYERCITNKLMIEIIEMLPNLNLFVLELWIDETLENSKDSDYINTVDKCCKSTGRRIAFYLVNNDFKKIVRYSLNEDIANPFKTDNQFVLKYFRCEGDLCPSFF